MTKESLTRTKTLKELRKETPSESEIRQRLIDAQDASDYEAAMISAALLEHLLMLAILTKFIPLSQQSHNSLFTDGLNAPISTFSSKVKIGYALGLMTDLSRRHFDSINIIRNHFAHHRKRVSFDDDALVYECSKLVTSPRISAIDRQNGARTPKRPKLSYVHACLDIAIDIAVYLEVLNIQGTFVGVPIACFDTGK